MTRAGWLAAALALAGAALPGQGWPAEARTIDGRSLVGSIAVDGSGRVTIAGAEGSQTLQLDELTAIVRQGGSQAPPPAGSFRVWLRSGAEVSAAGLADPGGAAEARLVDIGLPAGSGLRVPLAAIAAIRGETLAEHGTFAADRKQPSETRDFLFVLREGKVQRFSVSITGFPGGRIAFTADGSDFAIDADGLAGIVFGRSTGFAPDPQPLPRVVVHALHGTRLPGRLLQLGTACRVRLDEGAEVELPAAVVERIEVVGDRLVWLSALTPQVEQTAAFDRVWPWTADRSPVGPGIRLGGREYARGFVVVPRTRLSFALDGRYDRFEATIGIEDRGGPQAHAIFRVLADGKELFASEPFTRGQPPQELRLQIQGVKVLALEADFGRDFDLGDLCVFADARVIRP